MVYFPSISQSVMGKGCWLEMQVLGPQLGPTESEYLEVEPWNQYFKQVPQVILTHTKF